MADAFKLKGMDETLTMLRKLPAEVVSKNGGPVRASARKGLVVIQKQEIANLRNSNDPDATDLLAKNIVVSRGKAPSGGNGERMLLRVRRKSYPNRPKGGGATTVQTAQLKEYGSEKQAPEPFIVPAFKAKVREAIEVVRVDLIKRINRIARKLWKGSR
jgi:hypothetical protein